MALRPSLPKEEAARGTARLHDWNDNAEEDPRPGSLNISTAATTARSPFSDSASRESPAAAPNLLTHPAEFRLTEMDSCATDPDPMKNPQQGQLQRQQRQQEHYSIHYPKYHLRLQSTALPHHHQDHHQGQQQLKQAEQEQCEGKEHSEDSQNAQLQRRHGAGASCFRMMPPPPPPSSPAAGAPGTRGGLVRPSTPRPDVIKATTSGATSSSIILNAPLGGAVGTRYQREVALYGDVNRDSKGDPVLGVCGSGNGDGSNGDGSNGFDGQVHRASGHLAVLPQSLSIRSDVIPLQPQQPKQPKQPQQLQQQHEADGVADQTIAPLGALQRNNSSFGRAAPCAFPSSSNPSTPAGSTSAALVNVAAAAAISGSGSGVVGNGTTATASPRDSGSDTVGRGSHLAGAATAWGQPPGHGLMGRPAPRGEAPRSLLAACASAEGCEANILHMMSPDQATPKPTIEQRWNGCLDELRDVRMRQQELQQPKLHGEGDGGGGGGGGDGGGLELQRKSFHRLDLDLDLDPDSNRNQDENPGWDPDDPHPEDSVPYFMHPSRASPKLSIQQLASHKRGRIEIDAAQTSRAAAAGTAKRVRQVDATTSMAAVAVAVAAAAAAVDPRTESDVTAEVELMGGQGGGPHSVSVHLQAPCSEVNIEEDNRTTSAVQFPVAGSSSGHPQPQPSKLMTQPPYSPCLLQKPSERFAEEGEPLQIAARPQGLPPPPPPPPPGSPASTARPAGLTLPAEVRLSSLPEPIYVTVAASISKRSRAAAGDVAVARGPGRRGKMDPTTAATATATATTAAAVKAMAAAQLDDHEGITNAGGGGGGGDDHATGGDASGCDAAASTAGMPPMTLLRQRRAVTLGKFMLYLRPEMTCTVLGVFHPQRYMDMTDCIECPPDSGNFITRSHFEKVGGAATAKWYRSIRVLPNLEHLGSWLTRFNLPVFKGVGRRRARRSNAGDQGEHAAATAGTNSPNAVPTGANAPTNAAAPTTGAAGARTATTGDFAGPGCGPWPGAPPPPAVAAGFAATAPPPPPDLLLKDQPLNDSSTPGAAAMAEALAEAAAAAAAAEEPGMGADPYGTWYGDDVPTLARYRPSRLPGRGQYARSGAMRAVAAAAIAAAAPTPTPVMPSPELPRALQRTGGAMEGRWPRAHHIDGVLHDIKPPPGRYDKRAMPYHQHASQNGGWSQRGSVRPMGHRNAGTRRLMSAPTLDGVYDHDLGVAAESGRAGDRGGACRSAERGGDGAVLLGDSLEPWLAAAAAATMPSPSCRSNSADFWRDRTDTQYANDVDGPVNPLYIIPQASTTLHRKKSAEEGTEPLAAALALTSARSHTTWSELPFESPSVAAAAAAAAAAAPAAAPPSLSMVPTVLTRPSSHHKGILHIGRSRDQGVDDVIFLQQPQEQIRFRSESDPSAVHLAYETQHKSPQQPLRRGSYDHPLDASLGRGKDTTPTLIDQGNGGGGAAPLSRQQPHQSYTTPHPSQYHKVPTDPGWRPLRPPYTHAPTHGTLPYGSVSAVRAVPRPPSGSITRPRAEANSDPVAIVAARPRRPSYEVYGREFMTMVRQAPGGGVAGTHAAAPPDVDSVGSGSGRGSGSGTARPPPPPLPLQRETGCDTYEDPLLDPAPEPNSVRDYLMWLNSEKQKVPFLLAAAAAAAAKMAGEEVVEAKRTKAAVEMAAGMGPPPPPPPHVSRARQRGEPSPPGPSSRPFAINSSTAAATASVAVAAAATVAFSGRADGPSAKIIRQQSLPSPPPPPPLLLPPPWQQQLQQQQELQVQIQQQRKQQSRQLQHFESDGLLGIPLGQRQQRQLELELVQMQLKKMQQQQPQQQQPQQLLAWRPKADLTTAPAAPTVTTWRRLESLPYRAHDALPYNMPYNDADADVDDAGGRGGGGRTVDMIILPPKWNQRQPQQSWEVRSLEGGEEEEEQVVSRIAHRTVGHATSDSVAAAAAAPATAGAGRKRKFVGPSGQ
ncbi:hypothetical protein VaNZ11_004820 [Volvox africanus]|uniref:RegA n=1 Tax=Volvox africanus TaxID=51714 RepID=A0ABQ5RYI2_9CHLO|nr:hypothetical protein VaNZ11_004820 [Volvox africanus]